MERSACCKKNFTKFCTKKITHNYERIQARSFGEDYNYKEELINSILNFMQTLSTRIIGAGRLIDIMTDNGDGISEDEAVRLTSQIRQLEKLIDRLDTISPVESFIYTDIINQAAISLSEVEDISEFDLEQDIAKEYSFENLNLSRIAASPEQRNYLFEEYQLSQRYPQRVAETTQAREQGGGYLVGGVDHVNANLRLVQSLRARSVNPVETHIPELAALIDEHVAYIRKGIIDTQKLFRF